jgi:glutathione peroxidase
VLSLSVIRLILVLVMFFNWGNAVAKDKTAYDFEFIDGAGKNFPLSQFKGKILLVVNTASQCGFTSQYTELEELWRAYKDKGLMIIAVPSNDFGGQEPGTDKEIKEFCETNYKITFPIMAKVKVTGDNAHPFYKWASSKAGIFGRPKWNFHKYFIGKDGNILEWFASPTSPTDSRIISLLDSVLE